MIKIEPVEKPQPPTKFEFLEYLEELGLTEAEFIPFGRFQRQELSKRVKKSTFEESFNGNWRKGQEIHKVVITQRLYQTSSNSTQA